MASPGKKRWADLTTGQKVGLVVSAAVQLSLLAAALWDIRHRPAHQIRGSKKAWTAAAFVNYVGPIAYFLLGRRRPGGGG